MGHFKRQGTAQGPTQQVVRPFGLGMPDLLDVVSDHFLPGAIEPARHHVAFIDQAIDAPAVLQLPRQRVVGVSTTTTRRQAEQRRGLRTAGVHGDHRRLHFRLAFAHEVRQVGQGFHQQEVMQLEGHIEGFPQPADQRNHQQRVSAQLEEVVVQADALDLQQLGPDGCQALFQLGTRGHMGSPASRGDRCRQRLAVELAVRRQRHPLQHHQVRRHHIVRQSGLQVSLEFAAQDVQGQPGPRFGQYHIGRQLLARRPLDIDDTGCPHRCVFLQACFDFAQFDAQAANLHLVVETADVLDHAPGAIARQVAGAIQACPALFAEGIGNEAFGGQRRTLMITTGQALAPDQQLTPRAQRQGIEILAEDMQRGIGDGATQPDIVAGCQVMAGRPDGGLGRAIDVPHMPGLGDQALCQFATQRLAAAEHLASGKRSRRRTVEQHAPGRRRGLDDTDRLLFDHRQQGLRVLVLIGVQQHHRRPAHQWQVQFQPGDIERQRGQRQHPVASLDTGLHGHAEEEIAQAFMPHGDPLGLTGGTGGVDHVRQVFRLREIDQRGVADPLQPLRGQVQAQAADPRRNRQARHQLTLRQQQRQPAVLHHVGQAILGEIRVQRHIGTASLEDRQQADQHVRPTLHRDPHQDIGADPLFTQASGQLVGAQVQLPVVQFGFPPEQRGRLGRRPSLPGNQFVDALLHGRVAAGAVPLLLDLLPFGVGQQRHVSNTPVDIDRDRLQQRAPVTRHALDSAALEQGAGIGQRGTEAVIALAGVQGQVELRRVAVRRQALDLQARQLTARTTHLGLVVVHHLEQRAVAQAAFRLQGFHQLFERQVLMPLGLQGGLFHLLQQFTEAQLGRKIGLEHLGIDEETYKPLGLDPGTVGDRHADTDIGLPGIALQQGLERRQQQHEQGHALLAGRGLERLGQPGIEFDRQPLPGITLVRGTRPVEGQLQHRLLTAQSGLPVIELATLLPGRHPLALPDGVVGVLDRQCRQFDLAALAVAFIQLHQLVDHDRHRPAVGHDMVQGHHQHMGLRPQAQQPDPQQRSLLQVERPADFLVDVRGDVRLREHPVRLIDIEHERRRRPDDLAGLPTVLAERRAQGFMARDQRLEAATQGLDLQDTVETQGRRDIVGGALRLQLPEKPLALLGIGQPQRLLAIHPDKSRGLAGRALPRQFGELGEVAGLEQAAQGQFDLQALANPGNHLGRQQRMPAQVEEIVLQADPLDLQYIRPDRRQLLLQRCPRRNVLRL